MSAPVERDAERVANEALHTLLTGHTDHQWKPAPNYDSWDGMGLVIAAMRKQHVEVQQRFLWWLNDLCSGPAGSLKPDWVVLHMTPQAVRAAARAALEREVGA